METESYAEPKLDQTWQQSLVEGMGFTWKEQDYPTPAIKTPETFDVGLNWNVHPDWTSKLWSKASWEKSEGNSFQSGLFGFLATGFERLQ